MAPLGAPVKGMQRARVPFPGMEGGVRPRRSMITGQLHTRALKSRLGRTACHRDLHVGIPLFEHHGPFSVQCLHSGLKQQVGASL